MITESEMTAAKALELRKAKGLTQEEFWGPIGVKQSVACRYEKGGKKLPLPRSVRILLVARYVCGLEMDTSSTKGVEDLAAVAGVLDRPEVAKQIAIHIKRDVIKAIKGLETARNALESL